MTPGAWQNDGMNIGAWQLDTAEAPAEDASSTAPSYMTCATGFTGGIIW